MESIKKASKHGQMREKNLRIILEQFSKGTFSTYTLGKMLGFSTGGAKKLVDEIVKTGAIVKVKPVREYHQGRTPICYTINKDYQCIVIVNYATNVVSLKDFCGNKIDEFKMPTVSVVNDESIIEIADEIEYMIDRHKNYKLGAISIAYVGKFDEWYDHYYSGHFASATINLYEYFTERFGVRIIMHNDLNFSLMAKKKKGIVSDSDKAACLFNIGRGVACSMLLGGKLYTGAKGLAGEIGNNIIIGSGGQITERTIDMIAMYGKFSHATDAEEMKNEIVQKFYAGDQEVVEEIFKRARNAARLLRNIVQLLDFDKIIIQGSMLLFGEEYKKVLFDSFYNGSEEDRNVERSSKIYNHVKLICTDEKEEDIEIGAFEVARDEILDELAYQWALVPYKI